jgi:hypothetical protein
MKFLVVMRDLMSQENSCQRKKIPVTGRKIPVTGKKICYRNKSPVKGRKLCYRKNIHATVVPLLYQLRPANTAVSGRIIISNLRMKQTETFYPSQAQAI